MSEHRYTAKEMRIVAGNMLDAYVNSDSYHKDDVVAMLRQAANTEEELATLKGERNGLFKANKSLAKDNDRLRGENAKLTARLEAVVKMLEEKERATSCSDCGRYNGYPCSDHGECGLFKSHEEFTAILRAARGEGGAE